MSPEAVQLYDLQTGKPIGSPLVGDGELACLAFNSNGLLASGSNIGHRGSITIWDLMTCAVRFFKECDSVVTSMAFSPCGKFGLSTSGEGVIESWLVDGNSPTSSCSLVPWPPRRGNSACGMAVSSNGRVLAACSEGGDVKLLNLTMDEEYERLFISSSHCLLQDRNK